MLPANALEAVEVVVVGNHNTFVFDGESGQVGVHHPIACNPHLLQELSDDAGVVDRWHQSITLIDDRIQPCCS